MDITSIERVHNRRGLIKLLEEGRFPKSESLVKSLKDRCEIYRGSDLKDIFHFLVNIDLSEEKALLHWEHIMEHKHHMSVSLRRDVGLRVAIFDYFLNIVRLIKNPKVVEHDEYVTVLESAFRDSLTGLYNRRYLDSYMERLIGESREHNKCFSVIFFDLDNFKRYNDRFGHQAGDKALRQVSAVLRLNIRSLDVLMRYAGEEFVMVMPDTNKQAGIELGNRLKDKVEDYCRKNLELFRQDMGLTVSGGVSAFPEDGLDATEILKRADIALYIAKRAGKNKICEFYIEKRRFSRKSLDVPIKYSYDDAGSTVEMYGVMKNICDEGILFESHKEVPFGIDVDFKIDGPSADSGKVFKAMGRVVRKTRTSDRDRIEIAAAFTSNIIFK